MFSHNPWNGSLAAAQSNACRGGRAPPLRASFFNIEHDRVVWRQRRVVARGISITSRYGIKNSEMEKKKSAESFNDNNM